MNSVDEMHAPVELADIAADLLARLRTRAPRVHCITNSVAQQFTANVLLAAGAVPSMTISPEEIGIVRRRRGCPARQSRHVRCRTPHGDRMRRLARRRQGASPGCSIRCSSNARRRAHSLRATCSREGRRSCASTLQSSQRFPAAIPRATRRRASPRRMRRSWQSPAALIG